MRELENFEILGWHHGFLKDFEQKQLIKIINKIEKNGCAYIDFHWPYGKKIDYTTLFPESWDYHKINAKIKEASQNVINIIEQEGKYEKFGKTIIGKTSEGIEIKIVLKRDSIEDKWKTASAYVSQSYIKGH